MRDTPNHGPEADDDAFAAPECYFVPPERDYHFTRHMVQTLTKCFNEAAACLKKAEKEKQPLTEDLKHCIYYLKAALTTRTEPSLEDLREIKRAQYWVEQVKYDKTGLFADRTPDVHKGTLALKEVEEIVRDAYDIGRARKEIPPYYTPATRYYRITNEQAEMMNRAFEKAKAYLERGKQKYPNHAKDLEHSIHHLKAALTTYNEPDEKQMEQLVRAVDWIEHVKSEPTIFACHIGKVFHGTMALVDVQEVVKDIYDLGRPNKAIPKHP